MELQQGKRHVIDTQGRDHRESYEAEYSGPLFVGWSDGDWKKVGEYFFTDPDGRRDVLMVKDEDLISVEPLE